MYEPWRPKCYYQFKIITNGLVSSFTFIWIPMLWVYDHFFIFSTPLYVRIWRLQTSDSDVSRRSPSWKAYSFNLTKIYTHMKLCLATATHNLKWVKITHNYLFNWWPNIYKYWCLNTHFVLNNCDLIRWWSELKSTLVEIYLQIIVDLVYNSGTRQSYRRKKRCIDKEYPKSLKPAPTAFAFWDIVNFC